METSIEDVRDFVFKWNVRCPIDRWWRQKHNIPFNSPDHRASNFIDQLIEKEEDKLYQELYEEHFSKKDDEDGEVKVVEGYIPGKGNFFKKQLSDKELDDQFNSINLDDFKL